MTQAIRRLSDTLSDRNGFIYQHPPLADEYMSCIKCGLCLSSCPTFQETGQELESPRGRVQLIASVAKQMIPLDGKKFEHTLFSCLDCRACEVACPSGVPIGRLIEKGRSQIVARQRDNKEIGRATRLTEAALHQLIERPKRLQITAKLLHRLQRIGLFKLSRRLPIPEPFRMMSEALPEIPAQSYREERKNRKHLSQANRGPAASLFLGCVMDVLFASAHSATERVLIRHGFTMATVDEQGCCGALSVHAGDFEGARNLARKNIDQFLQANVEYVVTNAGGCGAALMEYPEWFQDDPIYRERAQQFAEKVRDAAQLLVDCGFNPPKNGTKQKITYQASCHLHNVMKVGAAPQQILRAIPGVEFVAMPDETRCCGSAGIYNLTHPKMAQALLDRKMEDVPLDAEIIATGNPGCWLQMMQGVSQRNRTTKVAHVMEILDRAYTFDDK